MAAEFAYVPWLTMVGRLLMAAGAGAIVGFERKRRDHPAGLRTLLLVSAGSCLFTLVSIAVAGKDYDPGRVAAGIITGIGFLGAGTILRHGATVQGLTTAASIWAVSAVGMAAGLGWWEAVVAGTVLMFVSLTLLKWVEQKVVRPRHGPWLQVQIDPMRLSVERLRAILVEASMDPAPLDVRYDDESHSLTVAVDLERVRPTQANEIVEYLAKVEGVRSARVE